MQSLVAPKETVMFMLSKAGLIKEFSKDPKKYYSVETFQKEGFERGKCVKCGKFFWTTDSNREYCGEPEHESYTFIKERPKEVDYQDMWFKFAEFFKKNGHEIIDKYPVVSRWRPDLYFTIASIQDFQRIENGRMSFEYPANPLLVPQICLRFKDISNVGVTGRHFTSFMMAGQHSFNYPKEGYWRDRCIELNYKYLTTVLGVKKKDLTYIEDVWAMGDFSEYGPSLEFFSNGLELGNNVFTQFEYVNGKVDELKGKVVDVGWGFERQVWFASGAQTAYDAISEKELDFIYKNTTIKPDLRLYSKVASALGKIDVAEAEHGSDEEKAIIKNAGISEKEYYEIIKPMQAAYAIVDHSRTLLFAISDGALPSNVGGGYNLRILLRRIFDFMERYEMKFDLLKLIEIEADGLKKIYKGIDKNMEIIGKIVEVEKIRYKNMKNTAQKMVTTIIDKKEKLTAERMSTLYESNGITPEFIAAVAKSKGVEMDVQDELYTKIMKGDFAEKHKHQEDEKITIDTSDLPKTEDLFYKFVESSDSTVLKCEGNLVVLDKSPFYAEGGGQEADKGTIDGHKVKDVNAINGVIIHIMEEKVPFKKGIKVKCMVDLERRTRLMAHHTATHLINASARQILGKHAWQEGANKGPNKAHIDIAHFEKLTEEQVQQIENQANLYVLNGIKVSLEELDRKEAEKKYGFTIYQGHGVPQSKLRIIVIKDLKGKLIDAQACGGLHLIDKESLIGLIKIISASRPHDGIDRLEFVAGLSGMDYVNKMEEEIRSVAKMANLDRDKVKQGLEIQLKDLQFYKKEFKRLSEQQAASTANELANEKGEHVIKQFDYDRKILREIATLFTEKNPTKIALLYNKSFEIVCIAGDKSKEVAINFLKAHMDKIKKGKFTGGGSKKMAEGVIL
jgi:alanyl-tRNA synthetase